MVPLYFAAERPVVRRDGTWIMVDDERFVLRDGERVEQRRVRFRTLGCYPLTGAVESDAADLEAQALEVFVMPGMDGVEGFRAMYPKSNGLLWATNWLQLALYDPLMYFTTEEEKEQGIENTIAVEKIGTSSGTSSVIMSCL